MKLFLGSFFVVILAMPSVAFAQDTIWNNTGGTSFENPNNWNNGVPTASSNAYAVPGGFGDPAGTFDVLTGAPTLITIDASSSESSTSFNVTNDINENLPTGTVTLAFASGTTYTLSGGLYVNGGDTLVYSGNLNTPSATVGGTEGGTLILGTGTATLAGVGTEAFVNTGGAIIQNNGSVVSTTGGSLLISGAYTVNSGATLQASYVAVGGTSAPTASLNISASGTVTTTASTLYVGTGAASSGAINQSGGVVNLTQGFAFFGVSNGVGTYNLSGGQLNIGTTGSSMEFSVGDSDGGTGSLVQSGGSLVAGTTSHIFIGNSTGTVTLSATGSYSLSNGSADFLNGFTVGKNAGAVGTITQSGGVLTVSNAAAVIGAAGVGSYQMSGGQASFNAGLTIGASGSFLQTGGVVSVASGQTIDLSAPHSSYTIGGNGILQVVSFNTIVGTTGEGKLNFAGGTLQVVGTGGLDSNVDGTVTGQSTIEAVNTSANQNVSLGNYTGTGGLNLVGGANTFFELGAGYTGATNVFSGTLIADVDEIAPTSALNINSGAGVNLETVGNQAYNGVVAGSGMLNVNYSASGAVLVLPNTNGFGGTITLGTFVANNGGLQIYSGTYNTITDSLGVGSVYIGGASLASGVPVPSSGVVTILNAGYRGATTVAPSFTLYANSLNGNLVNNGAVGLVNSNAVGSTFSINGALTQNPSGTLYVRSGAGTADLYSVGTTANLQGVVNVIGSGNLPAHPILTAGGGITIGGDGNLNDAGGLNSYPGPGGVLFRTSLSMPNANQLDLTTTQLAITTAASQGLIPALTTNQLRVANAIDPRLLEGTLPFGVAINEAANVNTSSIGPILDSLSPETLQYARDIAFENSTFLAMRMNNFDADLRGGYQGLDTSAISVVPAAFNNSLGQSMEPFFASGFHDTAPNGVNYYPGGQSGTSTEGTESIEETGPAATPGSSASARWSSSSQVMSDTPNPYLAHQKDNVPGSPAMSEFIGGDVVLADLNQNQSGNNAPPDKASYTAGDVIAGVSFKMTNNLAAGVLFDYNHTTAKTDNAGSKTDLNSYSPGLFATYFDHGFYANGLLSFGYNTYSNHRQISFLGEGANSSPNGQQYVGDLDLGYDFHQDKNWVWGPTAGVTYTHLDIDSFTETGAPLADLNVSSQSADSLRSRLGGHAVYQTLAGNVLLQPNLAVMWQHEYLDNSSGITSSFANFTASPFTVQTAAPSRDSALISVGLDASLSNSMAVYLAYLADVGADDYFAQSVVGGFKARF